MSLLHPFKTVSVNVLPHTCCSTHSWLQVPMLWYSTSHFVGSKCLCPASHMLLRTLMAASAYGSIFGCTHWLLQESLCCFDACCFTPTSLPVPMFSLYVYISWGRSDWKTSRWCMEGACAQQSRCGGHWAATEVPSSACYSAWRPPSPLVDCRDLDFD